MRNKDIANILAETADLMEIAADDSFRIRSYRNGASAIESTLEPVEQMLAAPGRSLQEVDRAIPLAHGEIIRIGAGGADSLYTHVALSAARTTGLGLTRAAC